MLRSRHLPHDGGCKAPAVSKEIAEVSSLRNINISPLKRRFVVIRWVYVECLDVTMNNFSTGQILESIETECETELKSTRRQAWRLKLSDRDSYFFGFLMKYGYQLLFKCISDKFNCFAMGNKWFHLGFLGISVPNCMILSDLELICKKHGYQLRVVEEEEEINWGKCTYKIHCCMN